MIERMLWEENPFVDQKPMKITFHTSSLTALSDQDSEALNILEGMAHLPEIKAIQTEPGIFPCFEIGRYTYEIGGFPLKLEHEDGILHTSIHFPYNPYSVIERFTEPDDGKIDENTILDDLKKARASSKLNQHLFVTAAPHLLNHQGDVFICNSNICSPAEATKIVGLFLRSRGIFTHTAGRRMKASFNRGHYYWVFARYKLPSMWRYFTACVYAEQVRGDDILFLGQSVLERAVRALQACDAVGIEFYRPQNNDTRDVIMYHFDYLLLTLTGMFDAQSIIAYRAYNLTKPKKEKIVSFRNEEFLKALHNCAKAQPLYQVITTPNFENLELLLYELRNTIHGAGLRAISVGDIHGPESSFVNLPIRFQQLLWDATNRLGGPEKWGVFQYHGLMMFEPYTFSKTIILECFHLINQIADATDVFGLFPPGNPIPQIDSNPPDEEMFGERMGKRLSLLV